MNEQEMEKHIEELFRESLLYLPSVYSLNDAKNVNRRTFQVFRNGFLLGMKFKKETK